MGKTRLVVLAIAVVVGIPVFAYASILWMVGQLPNEQDDAVKDVERCLEAADHQTTVPSYDVCGRLVEQPEWTVFDEQLSLLANDYAISIVWYNYEDNVCCRGGDEILLQVDFANAETYYLLWYEGLLEQFVTLETQPTRLPR